MITNKLHKLENKKIIKVKKVKRMVLKF